MLFRRPDGSRAFGKQKRLDRPFWGDMRQHIICKNLADDGLGSKIDTLYPL